MKRKEKKRKKKRISLWVKLLLIVAVCAGLFFFASSSYFNVTSFQVEGSTYYSEDEILTMGNCKTGGNIFWGSGLADIKDRLEKDPYMAKVRIKRILPDKIKIEITERTQIGAVVYGDNYVVMDKDENVLRKTEVEPQLTLIKGLTISKIEVGQPIEVEEKVQMRQIMDMIVSMNESDMYFKSIEISEAGVKAYVLDYLVCVGTPQNITQAMETGNLQKVIRGLFDINIERGTVKVSGDDYISFSPAFD